MQYISLAPFLLSLSRWRELSSPLAGRYSKGNFPRIVSNRELLKMRTDFTGHILETKTNNRFLQECCHAEIGCKASSLTQQHSQEVRNRNPGMLSRAQKENHFVDLP